MENLMPKVAELLGVEIGEEFEIQDRRNVVYKFINSGLALRECDGTAWCKGNAVLISLLMGKCKIIKKPWKPKLCEEYYCIKCKSRKLVE